MSSTNLLIEAVGWISTALFLVSIVVPNRDRLHQLGILASITTGIYAFAHGATAIWIKWIIALFFHLYMLYRVQIHKSQVFQFCQKTVQKLLGGKLASDP